MKSNMLLKVSGILMIIGGSISLIIGIIAVLGVGALAIILGSEANTGMLMLGAVMLLVGAVITFIAGILGVKNAAKPEKAMSCIVFGALAAIVSILSNILTVVGGGAFSVPSLLTGLLLPVIYLAGAFMNKKSAV